MASGDRAGKGRRENEERGGGKGKRRGKRKRREGGIGRIGEGGIGRIGEGGIGRIGEGGIGRIRERDENKREKRSRERKICRLVIVRAYQSSWQFVKSFFRECISTYSISGPIEIEPKKADKQVNSAHHR